MIVHKHAEHSSCIRMKFVDDLAVIIDVEFEHFQIIVEDQSYYQALVNILALSAL